MKKSKSKIVVLILSVILMLLTGCNPPEQKEKKPVIYLYPTSQQTVNVKLEYKGTLTCIYPEYKEGCVSKS